MLDLKEPQTVFTGFDIATLADTNTVLAESPHPHDSFKLSAVSYGLVADGCMGVTDGKIDWIAPRAQLPNFSQNVTRIEGHGQLLTPGLIDCHTHVVYGGNRSNEWEARLTGVSYEDIARNGGGILSSVRATRAATVDELVDSAAVRVRRLLAEGVTTIEIKSGYGLDLKSEIKMLQAARKLTENLDVTVMTTLLAAHAVPPEYTGKPDAYIDLVCQEIIPAAKEHCSAVDAFCESIAFDVEQTKRVFHAAIESGLKFKVHGEQLSRTGISAIAAEMGALSADHLEYLSEADCQTMGHRQTVATVLPGAFYCLNETQKPPIKALREYGVPIALATDCNPGSSPVTSLLLMANMGCNLFALTPEESLSAITKNAAIALGLGDEIGTLQPGHFADVAIWAVESPAELVYGVGHNPCTGVYRRGRLIDRR